MINRENWKCIKAYLLYRKEIDQLSDSSMRLEEGWLRHLLEWADDKPFTHAPNIRPSFPNYILTARLDGKDKPLSSIYVRKVVQSAQRFFSWTTTHKKGYKSVAQEWIDTLKPPRMTYKPIDHEVVTLDEIKGIAQAPAYSIRDRRIRAAAVFWFLSGIRIGAFVTLPLSSIDLENLTVYQWPKLGVKTKFNKHATTYLLPIPELFKVVREWDAEVRRTLPTDGLWFAPLSPETGKFEANSNKTGKHRGARARKDLKAWLGKVNLPYHSPHKFRHGHAVYALKLSKDAADLKAVSMNLMHSNLQITDGVYGILSEGDVQDLISGLGGNGNSFTDKELDLLTDLIVAKLKEKI